jgi:hypothetical protein
VIDDSRFHRLGCEVLRAVDDSMEEWQQTDGGAAAHSTLFTGAVYE